MWRDLSLRGKLVLTGIALQLGVLALVSGSVYVLVGRFLDADQQEHASQLKPLSMAACFWASVAAVAASGKAPQQASATPAVTRESWNFNMMGLLKEMAATNDFGLFQEA